MSGARDHNQARALMDDDGSMNDAILSGYARVIDVPELEGYAVDADVALFCEHVTRGTRHRQRGRAAKSRTEQR